MCERCEEKHRRAAVLQNLAWLAAADQINARYRACCEETLRLLDEAPRRIDLWEEIERINAQCAADVEAIQSGRGQTRQ